jgi:anaerobic magnesium-protoporphyrin IX monomethyl ester cyclase
METVQITIPSRFRRGVIEGPVCLIIPPSVFLLDERVFMTLGILRIAAVLEEAGVEVDVLDLSGISNFTEAVEDYCKSSKAKCFGITATSPQLPAATEVAQTIRATRPDARIILGGPHVTLVNAGCKQVKADDGTSRAGRALQQLHERFDVLVAGDGEESILIACSENAPMLIDADDPKSRMFLTNDRLTELPFPARHLVDWGSYHYSIDGKRAYSIIAQLGCPFACGFCGGRKSPMLRRIRTRTSESIVAEMVQMSKTMKCNGFMFYDDELNVNKNMLELMNLIAETQKRLGLEWRLRGFIKAELFTESQAEAMYRAGFRWILTGFESGSPRILENIHKNATREDNSRCIEIAHKYGLKVKALMSMGHPGETLETVRETEKWLLEVRPDDFDYSIITCYPGTPYYDEAVPHESLPGVWVYTYKKTGDKLYQMDVDFTKVAEYYKGDPNGGYKAFVFTDELSAEQLVSLRGEIEQNVRTVLGVPFNPSAPAIRYEHSMGQMGPLPSNILRVSLQYTPPPR